MYILYATTKYGEGHVTQVGKYDDLDEIHIHVNTFANDVVLNIDYEKENL